MGGYEMRKVALFGVIAAGMLAANYADVESLKAG